MSTSSQNIGSLALPHHCRVPVLVQDLAEGLDGLGTGRFELRAGVFVKGDKVKLASHASRRRASFSASFTEAFTPSIRMYSKVIRRLAGISYPLQA